MTAKGHMDYLETSYSTMASLLKSKKNKVGFDVDVKQAWKEEGQAALQLEMLKRNKMNF